MFSNSSKGLALVGALCLSTVAGAQSPEADHAFAGGGGRIVYTSATNTWEYSGFMRTGVGDFVNQGPGVLGDDGGTLVGGGTHFLWAGEFAAGAGAGPFDFSTYTDFYWPGGFQVEVVGPVWTNIDPYFNNLGEGILGYQQVGSATLMTPIPDGTVLNGVFTFGNFGPHPMWAYSPACVGDVDGSGAVDFADILAILGAWGTVGGPEDVDGSGVVDFGDLLAVLGAWGPCPADPEGACCLSTGCEVNTPTECLAFGGSWLQGADCADSDGDRIPDAFELDDCSIASGCFAGTDPSNPDTDGDGIDDGDEVLGTLDGLDLPALGADPRIQDIFIEVDWMDDFEGGPAHTHRPTASSMDLVIASFAVSPVPTACGGTGIALHIDYGQGGPFTGGNFLGGDVDVEFPAEFNTYKAANFNPNRQGYFHYSIFAHRYNGGGSSGVGEYPGDDFMVTLQTSLGDSDVSKTMMHELGHNLFLHHGGHEPTNYKPNYNSVMNYRFQFPGVDVDCDSIGDGALNFSYGARLGLSEAGLLETLGTCGNLWIDWDEDGVVDFDPVARNINCSGPTRPCGSGGGCWDSTCDTLLDSPDWSLIQVPIPAGDAAPEIVTCQDVPTTP